MRFYDSIDLTLISWKWWDWIVSGRREAKIPYWWPYWWDWGDGWSIFIVWDKNEITLSRYKTKKIIKAPNALPWQTKNKHWKNWENLYLNVPIWTIIKNKLSWKIIKQINFDWEKFMILKWWKWWLWNTNFKSSILQYPDFATFWEPWSLWEYIFELQLIWDVSLIWIPSSWKTTLINNLCNAKRKTADYPFTTLIPNVWIVKNKDLDFVLVDIPWLIKWSADWKWLWNEFLRHILKSKIFCFNFDVNDDHIFDVFVNLFDEIKTYIYKKFENQNDFWEKLTDLEIKFFNKKNILHFEVFWNIQSKKKLILNKIIFFIFNKIDLSDQEIVDYQKNEFSQKVENKYSIKKNIVYENIFSISWLYSIWNFEYVDKLIYLLKNYEFENIIDFEKFENQEAYLPYVKKIDEFEIEEILKFVEIDQNLVEFIKVFEVYNKDIAQLVYITNRDKQNAINNFWENMKRKWLITYLSDNWIQNWDVLLIKSNYNVSREKYIMFEC